MRTLHSEAARALRERVTVYGLAAEFNAERDLVTYEACERELRARVRRRRVERLAGAVAAPLPARRRRRRADRARAHHRPDRRRSPGVGPDRQALGGKAYWRKLFVRKDRVPLDDARRICAAIIATGGMPSLFDLRQPD